MESTQITTSTVQASQSSYICLVFMMVAVIGLIVLVVVNIKKAKRGIEKDKADGIIQKGVFKHFNGLNLPENTLCTILLYNDKYEFKANGISFNLPLVKITDVCCKTDVDIQKQYVSSVGGAVGGAVLFGPIGAMIGGRAKQKKVKKVSTYLIITYMDNNDVKYIGFDATNSEWEANNFVNQFKTNGSNTATKIDL